MMLVCRFLRSYFSILRIQILALFIAGWALASEKPSAAGSDEDTERAVAVEFAYTSDILANVSGGLDRGARYLNNIDLTLDVDLDALGAAPNTRIFIYGLYNNGEAFSSDLAGDAQVASNIEAPVEAVRLYEAWIERSFLNEAASLRAGLYDVNAEFDALEASSLFINSAHGIGADIGQTGESGPSIFPVTSLGIRAAVTFNERWTARAAVLDATPGDPNRLKRTTVKLGDGAFIISELEYANDGVKIIGGHWRYTSAFETFSGNTARGNKGFYLRGETALTKTVSGFARFGTASKRHNDFSRFYSAGFVWRGAVTNDDALGLAVAIAEASPRKRQTEPLTAGDETALELTYLIPVSERFSVQPDLQYIIRPGAERMRKNALVFGVRTVFHFSI